MNNTYAYLVVEGILVDKLINVENIPDGYIITDIEYDGTRTRYTNEQFVDIPPQEIQV